MAERYAPTPLLLIVIWAGLLITFMVVQPSPRSLLFWLLAASALFCGGSYMLLSHRESRRTQQTTRTWLRRVRELVDVHDYVDDGHLPEYLDDDERRKVIEALEGMPVGSRSHRDAIRLVSPELLDE
jgi:hypothetical protein